MPKKPEQCDNCGKLLMRDGKLYGYRIVYERFWTGRDPHSVELGPEFHPGHLCDDCIKRAYRALLEKEKAV